MRAIPPFLPSSLFPSSISHHSIRISISHSFLSQRHFCLTPSFSTFQPTSSDSTSLKLISPSLFSLDYTLAVLSSSPSFSSLTPRAFSTFSSFSSSTASSSPSSLPFRVILYTRPSCSLCVPVHYLLRKLSHRYSYEVVSCNIDEKGNEEAHALYTNDIPVVVVEGKGEIARHRLDERKLVQTMEKMSKQRKANQDT